VSHLPQPLAAATEATCMEGSGAVGVEGHGKKGSVGGSGAGVRTQGPSGTNTACMDSFVSRCTTVSGLPRCVPTWCPLTPSSGTSLRYRPFRPIETPNCYLRNRQRKNLQFGGVQAFQINFGKFEMMWPPNWMS
jgi:hypothetical protein